MFRFLVKQLVNFLPENADSIREIKKCNARVTKRKILSDISKIFDPLGWISPVTVVLKLTMQES